MYRKAINSVLSAESKLFAKIFSLQLHYSIFHSHFKWLKFYFFHVNFESSGHSETPLLTLCYVAILKKTLPNFTIEHFFQTAEGDQITQKNVETKTYN